MDTYSDDWDDVRVKKKGARSGDADLREESRGASPEPDELISKSEVGLEAEIRHLYREASDKPWSATKPEAEIEKASHPPSSKFALVVRREVSTESDDGTVLHSITIHSPYLRKLLAKVFEGSREISTKLKDLTFKRPFHDFAHRWDKYLACIESPVDSTEKQHFELFDSILRPEVTALVEDKKDVLKQKIVSYDLLWTIFEPDVEVLTRVDGRVRIFKLMSSRPGWTMNGASFMLTCRCIDYNGYFFGYDTVTLNIENFEGDKPVKDLGIVPVALHPQGDELVKEATARGKKFASLKGWHYKSYTGVVTTMEFQRGGPQQLENGRVVIDPALHGLKNSAPILEPLLRNIKIGGIPFTEPTIPVINDIWSVNPYPQAMLVHDSTATVTVDTPEDATSDDLDEDLHHLCTSIVKGYCLVSKQWGTFQIDGIEDIQWSKAAFKRLILPHDYKELLLAFVDSHLNQGDDFDDIMQGKGKGMTVLLHGAPGLGKTLTAEAVAEEMKVPLYAMSSAQLGFDVETIEQNLRNVLDICAKWGAVLLLDEADVFLEQRQLTDLQRNRLVSVFLRTLEYYQGCMFLTTNRVQAFDLAFKSRIDLAIDFPKLAFTTRHHIWRTFVRASEEFPQNGSAITDDELLDLAELDINGREVKNLVKTGRLVAKRKGESLGIKHVLSVLSVQRGLPGDGSALTYAMPDWFQSTLGKLVVQMNMRVKRGIYFC